MTTIVDLSLDSSEKETPSPSLLPPVLPELLSKGVKLQRLAVAPPERHTETFHQAFQGSNVILPTVKTLILGPHMEWMVGVCPNVTTVSTRDYRWLHSNVDGDRKRRHTYELIAAAGRASNLQHFEMMEWWKVEYLEAVLASIPFISSLAMTGGNYHDGLEKFIPTLSKFTNLKTLTLAGAHNLKVGFSPPGCGNAYMGKGGAEMRRRVGKQRQKANESVTRIMFSACCQLETLWIGDRTKATVSRRGDGSVADIAVCEGQRDCPTDWPNS